MKKSNTTDNPCLPENGEVGPNGYPVGFLDNGDKVEWLRQLDLIFGNRINTVFSGAQSIEEAVLDSDLVIGGVLVPGAAAPKLVTASMISRMKPGILNGGGGKPKGMHWRTFERLKAEHDAFVSVSLVGMAQRLGLFENRLEAMNRMADLYE